MTSSRTGLGAHEPVGRRAGGRASTPGHRAPRPRPAPARCEPTVRSAAAGARPAAWRASKSSSIHGSRMSYHPPTNCTGAVTSGTRREKSRRAQYGSSRPGLGERLLKPGQRRAGGRRVELGQRQLRQQRGQPPQRPVQRQRRQPPLLHGNDHQPRGDVLQRQAVDPRRSGRRTARRRRGSTSPPGPRRPRRRSPTARSPGSWARASPPAPQCHGWACSQRSVARPSARSSNGLKLAAGAERAAHALDDDLQSALGEQPPEQQRDELPPPVGRAHEHGRAGTVGALRAPPSGRPAGPPRRPSGRAGRAGRRRRASARAAAACAAPGSGWRASTAVPRPAHGHRIACSRARPEIMPAMPKESRLRQTPGGKVPEGAGWFVLNAREARWLTGDFGAYTRFEGDERWPHLGINIGVLAARTARLLLPRRERPGGLPGAQRRVPAAHRGPGTAAAGVGLRPLPAVDRACLRRRRRRAVRGAGGRQPAQRPDRSTRCPSWRSATAPG